MLRSASTVCFRSFSLDRALEGIRAAGFNAAELCAIKPFCAHLDPDEEPAALIRAARSALERHELDCVSISGHTQTQERVGLERLMRLVRVCEGLETPTLIAYTGDVKTDEERQRFLEHSRTVADAAERAGVRFCLETDSELLPTGEAAPPLLAELDRPWIGLNYDIANVVFLAGADPASDLPWALPHLSHVHLKDKRGGKGVYDFPPLGAGNLPLEQVLAILRAAGFDGSATLEIEYFGPGSWPDWQGCVDDCHQSLTRWKAWERALNARSA